MISLYPFEPDATPPADSDPLAAYSKLHSELDNETIARMQLAENAVIAKENQAKDQIAQVLRSHLQPCVPDWVCFLLAHHLGRSEAHTLAQIEKDLPSMFIFLHEEQFEFHSIKIPFARWFLDRESSRFRKHNTLRMSPITGEKFDELQETVNFFKKLLHHGETPEAIPMEEFDVARARFAHFVNAFPPVPTANDDWEMMATTMGVFMEAASKNLEGQMWLHNPMTRSVSEALLARQLAKQFEADKICFREVVDKLRELEQANAKAVVDQLCRLLSLQLHKDMLPSPLPDLNAVLADYKSIGYANSWDGNTPELLQKARANFLPVTRVHTSGSGNQEVWACHHLKFYYRVDCS